MAKTSEVQKVVLTALQGNSRPCKCGKCKPISDIRTENKWKAFDLKLTPANLKHPIMHTTVDGRIVPTYPRCEIPNGLANKVAYLAKVKLEKSQAKVEKIETVKRMKSSIKVDTSVVSDIDTRMTNVETALSAILAKLNSM